MGKPQVTLTLAGDSSSLERTFQSVGSASSKMATEVGSSSKRVADETTESFGRTEAAAEGTYDKFDALESVGRGTADTMSGVGEIMKGNVLQGATDLAGGVAALADGFVGFLLPALKAMSVENLKAAASSVRATVTSGAQRVATLAGAAATNTMTVAQKALNLAMRLNPIGLIITALILLGTGLVIAYKKSETFRNIVNGAFRAVGAAASTVLGWIKTHWPLLLAIITGPIGLAVLIIAKHKDSIVGFFKAIPGAIKGAFSTVASAISAPFRAAFDAIRSAWNNTVGGKGFDIPGWVPNLGGKSFRIPYFHTGGVVSGALGSETMAVLRAGETVTAGRNSGGGATIVFKGDGSRLSALLMEVLRQAIQIKSGGDVQAALGR